MSLPLTNEIINGLAPDAASLGAARGLATARNWVSLGRNDDALWGECKGSGKEPYRTQIDLRGLGYRCSCPSRKFPCKHGLALMMLAVQSDAVLPSEPPLWVSEWLASRSHAAERAESKKAAPPAANPATNVGEKATRSAIAREARVAAGLDDLDRWLHDSVRNGLAALQAEAPSVFDTFAARMVDAQAPGVARLLRLAGGIATSGAGWQERLFGRAGTAASADTRLPATRGAAARAA
ncbi:SWIM zinc finger family protein, partial [Candidatus Gracilibacteria bacterium]|nr:SWIM zinc finger family protein [Candidatus Gracilibacteria bacterium]